MTFRNIDEKSNILKDENSFQSAPSIQPYTQRRHSEAMQEKQQTPIKQLVKREDVLKIPRPKTQMGTPQSKQEPQEDSNYSKLLEKELARVRAELEVSRLNERHLKEQLHNKSKLVLQLQSENNELKNEIAGIKHQTFNFSEKINDIQPPLQKIDEQVQEVMKNSSDSSMHFSESEDYNKFFAKLDQFQRETEKLTKETEFVLTQQDSF